MSIGSWSYEWAKTQQLSTDWQEQAPSTQTWAKESLVFDNRDHKYPLNGQENYKFNGEFKNPIDQNNLNQNITGQKNFIQNTTSQNNFIQNRIGTFEKVYFCDTQTSGRGQGTNSWSNPAIGTSLLSTWVFALKVLPPPYLTLKVGLALARASHATWPKLAWSLKAQNDLYLHDKKVAGLLLETISQGTSYKLLIGLGFNILSKPSEIAHATCLNEHLNYSIEQGEWMQFLSRLFMELQFLFQSSLEPQKIRINDVEVENDNFNVNHFAINQTEKESLIYYLNKNPNLTRQCADIDEKGILLWH